MTGGAPKVLDTSGEDEDWRCPKCRSPSGDSWAHCEGRCPLARSPHYDERLADAMGYPVPYATKGALSTDPKAAEIPSGFVLMPREPKPELVAAWWRAKNQGRSDYDAYRAMIRAAEGER